MDEKGQLKCDFLNLLLTIILISPVTRKLS